MATTLLRWSAREALLPTTLAPGVEFINGTNFNYMVLHFDQAGGEHCWFFGQIPENYGAAANCEVDVSWKSNAATTGNVIWAVQILGRTQAETWDVALSSQVQATSTRAAANALHVLTISLTAPALAPGDEFVMNLIRNFDSVANYTADADLIGVILKAA